MPLLHPQISAATQDHIEKQLAAIQAFSSAAFGGFEKIVALNFATAKQAIDRVTSNTENVFNVKAPHELLVHAQEQSAPQIERLLAYGRELASISADFREEVLHLVGYAHEKIVAPTNITVQTKVVALPVATDVKFVIKEKESADKVTKKASPKVPTNTQLTLLAEPELKTKIATKPTAKPAAKKIVPAKDKSVAKPAANLATKTVAKKAPIETIKAVVAVPKASSKLGPKSAVKQASKQAEKSTPVVLENPAPSVAKAVLPAKKVAAPAAPATIKVKTESDTVTVNSKIPKADSNAAESTTVVSTVTDVPATSAPEKKSAVKFPAALTQSLQGDKPTFPKTGSRPAFKAKSSPATGAKKRVRQ